MEKLKCEKKNIKKMGGLHCIKKITLQDVAVLQKKRIWKDFIAKNKDIGRFGCKMNKVVWEKLILI